MKKKKIKLMVALLILFTLAVPTSVYGYNYNSYKANLKQAETLLSDEQYDDSISAFVSLKSSKFSNSDSDFIDSKVRLASELKQSKEDFGAALKFFKEKKYIEAIESFKNVKELDKERYVKAQEKIKESSNLYITENIEKAKDEADNKKYDNAIEFLYIILNFDESNEEAANLKYTYNKEIQKIKDEEAKAQAAAQISQKQPINTSSSSLSNSINATSAPTNNSGYTVTANDKGWFSVHLNSGMPTPESFGIMYVVYGPQPDGIYYKFLGESVKYEITFHLPTGDVKESGVSSNEIKIVHASIVDVPRGQAIKIDISAVYKGKTYTNSFSEYINQKF